MDGWLEAHGKKRGYAASAQQMYEVSADWYANRTELSWIRHDTEKALEIFDRHGLSGEFWELT